MEQTAFCFQPQPLDQAALLPQLSRALEKRTQLLSREDYPGLWKHIDTLNALEKAPEEVLKRRRIRSKIWGSICLALGIFLFIPGLMKPQELLGPLLMGAVAIGAGIGAFFRGRKRKKNPFDKSAALLLEQAVKNSTGKSFQVCFSSVGMCIPEQKEAGADGETEDCIPYKDFEFLIETEDLFQLTYQEKVIVLQKRDLCQGSIEDFRSFIAERTPYYKALQAR